MIIYVVEAGVDRDEWSIRGIFDNNDQASKLFHQIKDGGHEEAIVSEYEVNREYDTEPEPIKRHNRYASEDFQR